MIEFCYFFSHFDCYMYMLFNINSLLQSYALTQPPLFQFHSQTHIKITLTKPMLKRYDI